MFTLFVDLMRDNTALEDIPAVAIQEASLDKQVLKWFGEAVVPVQGLDGKNMELDKSAGAKKAAALFFSLCNRLQ